MNLEKVEKIPKIGQKVKLNMEAILSESVFTFSLSFIDDFIPKNKNKKITGEIILVRDHPCYLEYDIKFPFDVGGWAGGRRQTLLKRHIIVMCNRKIKEI